MLTSNRVATMLAVPVIVVSWATAGMTQSRDLPGLNDRVDRVERALNILEGAVFRDGRGRNAGAPSADQTASARLVVRLTELENQIRAMTGQLEEAQFLVNRLQTRVDKLVGDVDYRLTAIERNMAAPVSASGQVGVTAAGAPAAPRSAPIQGAVSVGGAEAARLASPGSLGTIRQSDLGRLDTSRTASAAAVRGGAAAAVKPAALPQGSLQEQYDFAYGLLRRGDYPAAEQAFSAFLAQYPDVPLAANAQYWLGETHYVRGNFEAAAAAFLRGYERHRNQPKAADNLLKLGMTLKAMGQTVDACATFAQLAQEYPNASRAVRRRARQELQSAGCS